MSLTRPVSSQAVPAAAPLPLENGDRLAREEFERRYRAMPRLKKAELLKGIVSRASPACLDRHAQPRADLVTWPGVYKMAAAGVRSGDNSTERLGPGDEPQPDVLLMVPRERGGQAGVDPDGSVEGVPEPAAGVASGSASYDLHVKPEVYQEHGARESLVWRVNDGAVDWFVLRGDRCEPLAAGPGGIVRSEVFPELWFAAAARVAGDWPRVMTVLQQSLASREHADFLARRSGRCAGRVAKSPLWSLIR